MFKARRATKGERILALENRCECLERELGEEKERREALKKDAQGLFEEIADLFEAQQKRIEALETKVEGLEASNKDLKDKLEGIAPLIEKEMAVTSKMVDDVKKMRAAYAVHNEMRKDEIRALRSKVEAMEAKVAELEAKRVPVLSDLTGGGKKERPVSAKQIMDEWFNGKAEGGEGK